MCSCEPCACDACRCGVARLGDLERRVMEILWERPDSELRVRDVADTLPHYAYTTVATVLDRLVHTAVLMHEALAEDLDVDSALVQFAETLSPSEAAILRRTLNGLERKARATDQ